MKIISKKNLTTDEKRHLMQIWNNEYPAKLAFNTLSDLELYLNGLTDLTHYFVIDEDSNIQGWASTFNREDNIWFAIILNSNIQKKKVGTKLLNQLKANQTTLNGWVIDHDTDLKKNDEKYLSPLIFYTKNNFTICDDVRLSSETISAVKIKWTAN